MSFIGLLIIPLIIIIFLFILLAGWWLIKRANPPSSVNDEPQSTKQKAAQNVLRIITGIYALILLPACLFAILSPFAFAGGNSNSLPYQYMAFLAMATFPITIAGSVAIAWILYKRRNFIIALLVTLLPIIHFVISYFAPSLWPGS